MRLHKYKTHHVSPNTAALLHTVMTRIWELKTCGAFQGMLSEKKICLTFWVSINTKWNGLSMAKKQH